MRTDRRVQMTPGWVAWVKPEAAPIEYRDTGERGLVLRVEASGLKTWALRYTFAGRDRRYKIGASPAVSLKSARSAARRMAGLALSGTDPQLERERLRVGQHVAAAVAAWLADQKFGPASKWKGGLTGGSARSFLPHVRRFVRELGTKRLPELTPKDVERFVSRPEAAATRNRALTALRGLFSWAVRKGLIGADPTAALGKERETERSRVLNDPELRALIIGFDAGPFGRAVRLLALTGLRRDEVLGAKWTWVDADAGVLTIPPEAEKTGRGRGEPRRAALSPQAVTLLAEQRAALFAAGVRSDYVFADSDGGRPPSDALQRTMNLLRGLRSNGQSTSEKRPATKGPAKPKRQATLAVDATLHDLRRTIANALLNRLHVPPWVVDHVVLGHVRPKLLRTYMPNLPLDEARAALGLWANELAGIVADESAVKANAQ